MGCASSAPAVVADSGYSQVRREVNGVSPLSPFFFSLSLVLARGIEKKKKKKPLPPSSRAKEIRGSVISGVPVRVERDRDHELRFEKYKSRGTVWGREIKSEMRCSRQKKKGDAFGGDCDVVVAVATLQTEKKLARVHFRCARTQIPSRPRIL